MFSVPLRRVFSLSCDSSAAKFGFRKGALLALFAGAMACLSSTAGAEPRDFSQAKRLLKEHVYYDQNAGQGGTFYCGCDWSWQGRSGGRIDTNSCGFQTWTHRDRASRLEWEHTVAAHTFGQQRQCWRNGGRENCQKTDPIFNRMEADMHNVVPSVGSANAIRSNLPLGMVSSNPQPLGQCATKFDTSSRMVEPRDEAKGMAARITFYMADRYNLRLSRQQERTLLAWHRQFPVTEFELLRDKRIARAMGHNNDFVTGAAQWTEGFKPRAQGLRNTGAGSQMSQQQPRATQQVSAAAAGQGVIIGNQRSKVYHLPVGCPSYSAVGANNRVAFTSENEAEAAGYRKAGNCS